MALAETIQMAISLMFTFLLVPDVALRTMNREGLRCHRHR